MRIKATYLPKNSRVRASASPAIGVRTSNDAEREVCMALEKDGWEVIKRGWPDFLAVRDGEIRFIEVKPDSRRKMKPQQKRVAKILARLGIEVEILTPGDC